LGRVVDDLAGDDRRSCSMRFAVKVHTGYLFLFPLATGCWSLALDFTTETRRTPRSEALAFYLPLTRRFIAGYGATGPGVFHHSKVQSLILSDLRVLCASEVESMFAVFAASLCPIPSRGYFPKTHL
jgi:hypothetical protein